MSRVAAIRALEQLADSEVARPANTPSPGVIIRVLVPQPAPMVDVTPTPAIIDAGE
jgi:hypothetical protein